MPASASSRADSPVDGPVEVLVDFLTDHGDPAVDHRMLVTLAAQLAPLPPGASITHRCAACGSVAHGRPLLVTAAGAVLGPHVSLSRAGGRVALAATLAGPLGIDIESLDAVRAAAFDDVAFDSHERAALTTLAATHGPAAADRMRALAWTAKEAVLKATGTGLRADPRTLHLDLDRADGRPGILADYPMSLHPVDVAGLLGHVAVATDAPLRIRWLNLSPESS